MTCRPRAVLAAMLFVSACTANAPPPPPQDVVVWKEVGNWSGRGDVQTGIFTSDTGGFRVHWAMKNETRKDAGRLRVVLRSMDSGREIVEAVDYLTIESADADWTVSVDERIDAQTSRD